VNSTAELVHRSRVDDAVRLTLVATHEFSLEIGREELYELGDRVEARPRSPPASLTMSAVTRTLRTTRADTRWVGRGRGGCPDSAHRGQL
jgi:hypothetical protein